ncbi:MAG: hypothetical protein A2144_09445 [Chloroflexi bacterium RBG_16_50_9]|nr:MAG: hypothetical protein A2144_09445 [Chloroflexi bacterium RBG_16_50_9]
MVNWMITATTIYCDTVDDDVTLLVYKDGTAKCTGYRKYGNPGGKPLKTKSNKAGQPLRCEPSACERLIQYRDRLLAEETTKE